MATSFNPSDFFRAASAWVAGESPTEAVLRSAVSRAYYAVFLTARDRLFGQDGVNLTKSLRKVLDKKYQQLKGKRQDPGSHERIIFAVAEGNPTLSQQLDQLKTARVLADYQMDHKHLHSAGYTSWQQCAHRILALASQVLPSAQRLPKY